MYFGVAYYPEHWPEKRWAVDAKMMQDAGINGVRVGEFAWSKIERVAQRLLRDSQLIGCGGQVDRWSTGPFPCATVGRLVALPTGRPGSRPLPTRRWAILANAQCIS